MKRLLSVCFLISTFVCGSSFAADAANDLILTQRKPDNSGPIQRNLAAPAGGVFGFDGSKLPVPLTYASLKTAMSFVKADVGLGNVDNTSDLAKPISTATQAALDLKLAIATAASTYVPQTTTVNGHTLSGNVTVSKSDVSLGNADNTSDANKPVSTATQAALDLKLAIGVRTYDFTYASAPADATGSSGSWTWAFPSWANSFEIQIVGAGGGGGAGGRGPSGSIIRGGGGGSAGSRWTQIQPMSVSDLPSATLTIATPDGAAGAIAQTADNTAGANGGNPTGNASITTGGIVIAMAVSGLGGTGGGTATGGGGGSSPTTNNGGLPFASSNSGGAGGNGATAQNAADMADVQVASIGGIASLGGAGGGAVTAFPAAGNGGKGPNYYLNANFANLMQATSGGGVAAAGGDSAIFLGRLASSAGGGAANASGAGFRGGIGLLGSGGGGGGASLNGSASGAGGKGGSALVRIIVFP